MVVKHKVIITTELKAEIDALELTATQKKKAIILISNMLFNISNGKFDSYFPLSRNYLRKVFNDGRYFLWFDKLVRNNILQPKLNFVGKPTYWKGHCVHYRINPAFLTSNFIVVQYNESKEEVPITIKEEKWDFSLVSEDLAGLIVNEHKLKEIVLDTIDNFYVDIADLNDNINVERFIVKNYINDYEGYTTKKFALKKANELDGDLIHDNGKYFIDKMDDYIERKRKNLLLRYNIAILKLKNGIFYVSRNDTNKRLDHNLTALSNNLLSIIKEDNSLVEIDMANAQFAILAYIMETYYEVNSNDFKLFKHHVSNGTLYKFLCAYFKIRSCDAKLLMMKIAFPSHKYQSKEKTLFASIFPAVVEFIDGYKKDLWESETRIEKKKDAHKMFAVLLQTFESRLFIDHFYSELKRDGFWVITKHDSLIVKKSEASQVYEYLTERLRGINFDCTLRVKDNTNDYEDLGMDADELQELFANEISDSDKPICESLNEHLKPAIPTWPEYRLKNQLFQSYEEMIKKYEWMFNVRVYGNNVR